MSFDPGISKPIAHHLHLIALAGADPLRVDAFRAYARQDRGLRGKERAPRQEIEAAAGSLPEALGMRSAPEADSAWFERRWALGAEEALREHAERIAAEANEIGADALLPAQPMQLVASDALGRHAVACIDPRMIAVGPRTTGALVVLETLGRILEPALSLEGLGPQAQELVLRNSAASALLRLAPFATDSSALLGGAAGVMLPDPGREKEFAAAIRQLVPKRIDQAPGEIRRIIEGLCSRRRDRLLRAWRRGFFVPRGFDLDAWVGERRAAAGT